MDVDCKCENFTFIIYVGAYLDKYSSAESYTLEILKEKL
jgi:hypothetical protein